MAHCGLIITALSNLGLEIQIECYFLFGRISYQYYYSQLSVLISVILMQVSLKSKF